jgi:hypothetical protein
MYLVYILELSECYISTVYIAQHLEFIFRVPIRNTTIKNVQDLKKAYEIIPESVALPFKILPYNVLFYIMSYTLVS